MGKKRQAGKSHRVSNHEINQTRQEKNRARKKTPKKTGKNNTNNVVDARQRAMRLIHRPQTMLWTQGNVR
jgi:hypothetical protein